MKNVAILAKYTIGGGITQPEAVSVVQHVNGSQLLGDFTWRRGTGGIIQAEYLDLVIAPDFATANQIFGNGIPGSDYVSLFTSNLMLTSNPDGSFTAANLQLVPNAQTWWRVTNLIAGNWYSSVISGFLSINIGGGGNPTITLADVVFS